MKTIKLIKKTGSFAENKDIARNIRLDILIPAIEDKKERNKMSESEIDKLV